MDWKGFRPKLRHLNTGEWRLKEQSALVYCVSLFPVSTNVHQRETRETGSNSLCPNFKFFRNSPICMDIRNLLERRLLLGGAGGSFIDR